MPLSPAARKHEPSDQQQQQQHCATNGNQGDSDSSREDGVYDTIRPAREKPPAVPMEEPRSNAVVIRIGIPDLQQTKCMKFHTEAPIWVSKQRILCSLNQSLKDVLNYGLFQPAYNGKAGKFLDEERLLKEYPLPVVAPVPYLEFRYKRRVYTQSHLEDRQLAKLHTKANLKKFMEHVQQRNAEKVAKFLEKGLDPNFHDPDTGECPLTMAAQLEGCVELIKVLKSGGAHLDFRTRDGITALHKAVRTKNHTALITLLDLGASPDYKDSRGLSPLYHSSMVGGDPYCCELLLHRSRPGLSPWARAAPRAPPVLRSGHERSERLREHSAARLRSLQPSCEYLAHLEELSCEYLAHLEELSCEYLAHLEELSCEYLAHLGEQSCEYLARLGELSCEYLAHLGEQSCEYLAHLWEQSCEYLAHLGELSCEYLAHLGELSCEYLAHLGEQSCEYLARLEEQSCEYLARLGEQSCEYLARLEEQSCEYLARLGELRCEYLLRLGEQSCEYLAHLGEQSCEYLARLEEQSCEYLAHLRSRASLQSSGAVTWRVPDCDGARGGLALTTVRGRYRSGAVTQCLRHTSPSTNEDQYQQHSGVGRQEQGGAGRQGAQKRDVLSPAPGPKERQRAVACSPTLNGARPPAGLPSRARFPAPNGHRSLTLN
ncbi:hypothetical protein SKAU_G00044640 [Synaphobranchus kaupii]|uniref:SH3 and multiple ankyrin repeat domains protein 3 n=1 Tax=Synaphobranchus kaupii TaxID=118154 RepID=A0A9Q1G2T9_SYNKA|nr:hypothetical protein SKAU_G00044640 [Synaphobranchus kaupii]